MCPEIPFSFGQAGQSYTLFQVLPLSLTKQFQAQNIIPGPPAKAISRDHQSILERNFETKLIWETSTFSFRDDYSLHYEKSIPREGNFSSYGLLVPNVWLALMDSKNNKNLCSFTLISFYQVSILKMELPIRYYLVNLTLILESSGQRCELTTINTSSLAFWNWVVLSYKWMIQLR